MEAAVQTDRSSAESCLAHFADFCKALAIYPEANSRVKGALERFLQAARDGARPLRLAIPVLEEDDEDVLPPNIDWLRERFERSGLAAIDVPADVPEASVRAIGRRLLRNYVFNREASRFEELWPEPIEDVTLRARIFDGRFDGGDEFGGAGDGRGTGAGHKGRGEGEGGGRGDDKGGGTGDAVEDGPEGSVLWNQARDKITDDYVGIAHDAGDEICKQFLERLSEALPRELRRDEDRGTQACLQVLENVALNPLPTEAALGAMLVNIHRDLGGGGALGGGNHRDGWVNEPEEEEEEKEEKKPEAKKRAQGHRGDDKIVDDREAFDEELAKLPAGRTRPFTPAEAQVKAEQLDVLLHYVLAVEDKVIQKRLAAIAKPLLGELGPDELHLLGIVLQEYWYRADSEVGPQRQRLLNLLRSSGHTRLLRDTGVLKVEYIVEAFPQDFVLYLDCVDVRRDEHRAELARACRRLEPHAVQSAGTTLLTGDGLLEPARRDTLLAVGDASIQPFARLLFTADPDGCRGPVLRHLAVVHGPRSIAAALATLQPGPWMSRSLISRLIDIGRQADGEDVSLRDEASRAVVARMESIAAANPESAERLELIRALARLPSDRSRSVLRRLVRARRWLIFPAESKTVRDAASQALAALRGAQHGV